MHFERNLLILVFLPLLSFYLAERSNLCPVGYQYTDRMVESFVRLVLFVFKFQISSAHGLA